MAAPAYFLGLDVARNGLGLVILAGDGSTAGMLRRAYGGDPGAASDPQDWWRAARTGIKELLRRAGLRADQIRAIGVSGESESIVALDRAGKVLCPATLGPEPAAIPYIEALTAKVGARNLINLASGPATTGAMAVKLLWLRDHAKRVWHDLAHVLPAKDFLRYRLTGTLVTDACDASATLLFNPKTRSWSKQLLQFAEINPAWLPTITNGQAMSGRVTAAAARDSGLEAGTPVVTGAGHAAAAAIAAGALQAGTAIIELGGLGAFFAPTGDAARDPLARLQSTCHCVAGTWGLCATEVAGAAGLDWVMDHVMPGETAQARRNQRDPLDLLAEMASEVAPGADGLIHLAPGQRPTGTAASGFLGLDQRHARGHLVRAVMESGALSARALIDVLGELKKTPDRVVVTGPGAYNHLWCQIVADALDRTIHVAQATDCAAAGAAILASSAVGVHKSIEDACARMAKAKTAFHPRKAATDVYATLAPLHARLTAAIAGAGVTLATASPARSAENAS